MLTQIPKQTVDPNTSRTNVTGQILLCLAALLVVIKLSYDTHNHQSPALDAAILHYFQAHQSPLLYKLMTFCSFLGGTVVIVSATVFGVLYFAKIGRLRPDGWVMFWATGAGLALMESMKHFFPRERAYHIYDHLGSSYPSGHVLFALTVYGLWAHWLTRDSTPGRRIIAWSLAVLAALLVGVSRVYVGAHYPTDVLAGLSLGVLWLFGCLTLLSHFKMHSEV